MTKPFQDLKDVIIYLYINRRLTLEEVRAVMIRDYGFKASIRAYRLHFEQWDVRKYNTDRNRRRQLGVPPPVPTCSIHLDSVGSSQMARNSTGPPLSTQLPTHMFEHWWEYRSNLPVHGNFAKSQLHPPIVQSRARGSTDDIMQDPSRGVFNLPEYNCHDGTVEPAGLPTSGSLPNGTRQMTPLCSDPRLKQVAAVFPTNMARSTARHGTSFLEPGSPSHSWRSESPSLQEAWRDDIWADNADGQTHRLPNPATQLRRQGRPRSC